jgi:hypothetical protein
MHSLTRVMFALSFAAGSWLVASATEAGQGPISATGRSHINATGHRITSAEGRRSGG